MQAGHACIVSAPGARGLGERKPSPDGFYRGRAGLDAFLREGGLQIRNEQLAEASVGLGPRNDAVEAGPGERQLLRRLDPAARGRRKQSK